MNNGNSMTMEYFRRGFFSRVVSILTTFFFTFVFYLNPATKAMADELTKDEKRKAALEALQEDTPEQKLSHRLDKLRDKIVLQMPQAKEDKAKHANWLTKTKQAVLPDMPVSDDDAKELKKLQASIDSAYQESIANFEKDADTLLSNGNGKALSPEAQKLVKERHAQALRSVKEKFKATQDQLAAVIKADSVDTQQQALDTLNKSLAKTQFKRSHTPATPDHLPWGTSEGKVREPVETKKDLHAALGTTPTDNVQLAMADTGSAVASIVMAEALAAATTNIATELGESLDVQITPEIKELAESLNNNPVEIYTWVHNNIRFIPSYGSIQGSQYTLEIKQGNSIDTASLLIALLRASNIPAHYAYGTVEIPIEQVMNWVGGVTSPFAAQDLLNQGGIPNVLIKKNGVLSSFRIEHVWVEAWVDYSPGRGTKTGTGDTWLPMDASFKQYEYDKGMDLRHSVALDERGFSDAVQSGATINEAEGWVTHVSQENVDAALAIMKNQLATYVENQNPSVTVSEALGLRDIKVLPSRPLAAGLPYQRIVTSQTFPEVPDTLRHKYKYSLSTLIDGVPSDPVFVVERPTVSLSGKALSLSFKPASKADEDLLMSKMPALEADGRIDPNKLPKSLPGYLIKLFAEFSIDGAVVGSAPVGSMGSELFEEVGFWNPKGGWEVSSNKPTAGEYKAIVLDLQGGSADQAARVKSRLDATKAKLDGAQPSEIATLTKHDLIGDLLYSTALNYFLLNDIQDKVTALSSDIVTYRLPSFGSFGLTLKTQYWYGIPRNVDFSGFTMDIDHFKFHHSSKTNNFQERLAFSHIVGARMSAMEHSVPEQMLSMDSQHVEGISAVKALAIAGREGQKIWTITPENLELAMSQISFDEETKLNIRNNVNAGKIVSTHSSSIFMNGWQGKGYITLDPATGAGAYQISGGSNGGEVVTEDISKRLGWSQYGSTSGLSPSIDPMAIGISITLSLMANVVDCYKDEIKDVLFFALILIAVIAVGMFIAGSGGIGGIVVPAVMRYLLLAIVALTSANASAAGKKKYVCDLKCQVYSTLDPLKGIIGLAYGSACGVDRHSTYLTAKDRAGQYVNKIYGIGFGYRHCTPENAACKQN